MGVSSSAEYSSAASSRLSMASSEYSSSAVCESWCSLWEDMVICVGRNYLERRSKLNFISCSAKVELVASRKVCGSDFFGGSEIL